VRPSGAIIASSFAASGPEGFFKRAGGEKGMQFLITHGRVI